MILTVQKEFCKELLDGDRPSEFIDYVSCCVEGELASKLLDRLKDHKSYIVELRSPELIKDLPRSWDYQCVYRQKLECLEIVRCKNCRMAYPWCQKFRDELGGEGH